MPPKRGKADGSTAKAPMQSSTKRTRRELSQPSQSASGTEVNLPSHYNVVEDPYLIVDYNETTPLPSPQSGDEQSALMGHVPYHLRHPSLRERLSFLQAKVKPSRLRLRAQRLRLSALLRKE
ncbi:unnamed protein product [Peronospora farinosa]|uniref:Uncharacterized protein n=1 Tax=Peronospora farinosa TaxID=134698 RepID=A0AAV0THR7_9STRA|nr:unnamed protein product [Peronospora farinosa]